MLYYYSQFTEEATGSKERFRSTPVVPQQPRFFSSRWGLRGVGEEQTKPKRYLNKELSSESSVLLEAEMEHSPHK